MAQPEDIAAQQRDDAPAPSRKLVFLPNADAYNRWAPVYDSDGNILQALDSDALMRGMFARFLSNIPENTTSATDDPLLYLTDLGCGTGRATQLLMLAMKLDDCALAKVVTDKNYKSVRLTGVDSSSGMMVLAKDKISSSTTIGEELDFTMQLRKWDMMDPESDFEPLEYDAASSGHPEKGKFAPKQAHAVMSTLVLEHLPLDVFFNQAMRLLRPGGALLLTNMHNEMGNSVFGTNKALEAVAQYDSHGYPMVDVEALPPTGAAFNDAATNTKYRPILDFAHSVREVLQAAKVAGFELVDERVDETAVEPWMFESGSAWDAASGNTVPLLGSRGKKWLGTKCWFGMVFRRPD